MVEKGKLGPPFDGDTTKSFTSMETGRTTTTQPSSSLVTNAAGMGSGIGWLDKQGLARAAGDIGHSGNAKNPAKDGQWN